MFSKTVLLLNLFALTLAEPIPQAAATTSFDLSSYSFPTASYSLPASLESQLSQLSVLESILSGAPTFPASIESAYIAAIPTTVADATNPVNNCEFATSAPEWFQSLPANVKSAVTSYESAYLSWYDAHSAEIVSAEGTLSGTATFTVPSCGATTAATGKGATTTGAGATGTGSSTGSGTSEYIKGSCSKGNWCCCVECCRSSWCFRTHGCFVDALISYRSRRWRCGGARQIMLLWWTLICVYCFVPTMTTERECKCELAGYSSRSSRGKFTVTFVHESSLSESRLLQTLLPIYFALACLTLTKSPWHTTNNLHPE
jgi:hypothetical protein